MPDVTVPLNQIGSIAITLTANVVSSVTFTEDLNSVEVITDGVSPVWWTCDGSTPAAGAGYYLPVVGVDQRQPRTSGSTVVKLFSTGTPTVRVQRGD